MEKKAEQIPHQRRYTDCQWTYDKMLHIKFQEGNADLKNKKKKWVTTTYLLEWPKSRTLTTPTAGKDVEQQDLSFICPHKNLHMNVYSNLIHNCQNLEATKMPFSRRMEKEMVAHTDNGILFSA